LEELSKRSAREVLDDHLNIANRLGPDDDLERIVQDDLDRNVAEDCVILINRAPSTAMKASCSWPRCWARSCRSIAGSTTPSSRSSLLDGTAGRGRYSGSLSDRS
jgi:hypothetical protein